jgi:hypothetical protein
VPVLAQATGEFERIGLPIDLRERAALLEERLDVIDRLWRGESVTARALAFHMREVREMPRPVQQPRIPVWLAAGWPRKRPLRRAALWDGVYLMTNNQISEERLTAAEVAEAVLSCANARLDGGFRCWSQCRDVGTCRWRHGHHSRDGRGRRDVDRGADTRHADEHRALIRRGPPR